jgi:tRNA pseudouridine13 synthase
MLADLTSAAYLTADLPGIGGALRERTDDFLVQEQPATQPGGTGGFAWLYVQKRGLTTDELVRRVASAFRLPRRAVAWAGLKDKRAVTMQHLSVDLSAGDPSDGEGLDDAAVAQAVARLEQVQDVELLWVDRHDQPIERGEHGGNRFIVKLRQVQPTDVLRARPILERLADQGVPNYIGPQRFGPRMRGHLVGRAILLGQWQQALDLMLAPPEDNAVDGAPAASDDLVRARRAYASGDYEQALQHYPKRLRWDRQALDALRQGASAAQAVAAIAPQQRRMLATAWQSAVFNHVLAARLRSGAWPGPLPGDVLEDNAATGPMCAAGVPAAQQVPGDLERQALDAAGVDDALLDQPDLLEPRRRPLVVQLGSPEFSGGVDEHGPYLRVGFTLPRGAFATVALRELMKSPAAR